MERAVVQKTESSVTTAGLHSVGAAEALDMRVLVLAATQRDFTLTAEVLGRADIECCGCSSLDDLTNELRRGAGSVLIPEEAVSGAENKSLTRYLAEQPSWSDMPVLVLARPGADSGDVATAMDEYGNVTVLERPMRIAALVSAVRSALRARSRQYQVRDDARRLQEAHDLLEQRVLERTIELHQMNSALEQKMQETAAAEKRAHLLLRELVTAQETERARIARDLHDELGQQVTSLRLHLAQIERNLSPESRSAAHAALSSLDHEAAKIDDQISFLAWKIRPTTIEEMGLAKALSGYVREWSRNFEVAAEFRESRNKPRRRLLPEIETTIYRIAQESLNNIAKYAQAHNVDVLLTTTEKEVSLIVEDDGRGFDAETTTGPRLRSHDADADVLSKSTNGRESASSVGTGGLGIRGMYERAALLGGSLQVESTPDQGTTIYVRIPARFR